MLVSVFIPFFTILAAEFFDKSQLAILLLATKSKHHIQLLLGTVLAFALVDGLAILIGSWLTNVIPHDVLKIISGLAFILFGFLAFRSSHEEDHERQTKKSAFVSGFLVVFLSEWGDKTQIASAIFATQYSVVFVFIGVMLALTLLSILAIYVGNVLSKKINRTLISRISGAVFVLLGIFFLLS
ncbi:MAG: TMEM165/GDT1 family protein [Candidatus Levybacteria bacterium]|nr:TMEM165/GDT1 family protein [Candidatus Levybacteria bacterium]